LIERHARFYWTRSYTLSYDRLSFSRPCSHHNHSGKSCCRLHGKFQKAAPPIPSPARLFILLSLKSLLTSHAFASLSSLFHMYNDFLTRSCRDRTSSLNLSSSSLSFRLCASRSRLTPRVMRGWVIGSSLPPGMRGGREEMMDWARDGGWRGGRGEGAVVGVGGWVEEGPVGGLKGREED
jgi:hypothetical protein